MSDHRTIERLKSLLKEELWGRIEPKDIGISRFKILDDLFNRMVAEDVLEEAREICRENQDEHPDSITTTYLMGLIGYHMNLVEESLLLRKLIEIFIKTGKWAVVELLAEKILEYGESSVALRALATSLERQGKNKEAIPVWEDLLKLDRFDADVAKKLAFGIIEDDPDKSIQYMKWSIEGFIKNGDFDEVTHLFNKLVSLSFDDMTFFDRIERLLVENRQEQLAASILKSLFQKYRDDENPDMAIEILKKILTYIPDDSSARRDLIRFYEIKYGNHSQFNQFMDMSFLRDFKKPVKFAIVDFEKNIVFDKGNYAWHSSWGVGNIQEISSEGIVIDFSGKEGHKMSIKMALQSLTPLTHDHIYVMQFEDPDTLAEMFKEDFISFFEILIRSYGGEILMADIRRELVGTYLEEKQWSKWWSKARTAIKKDSHFGVSDKKKDLFFMRDKPVTFADELLEQFTGTDSFSERLDIAMEFINTIDAVEGASVAQYFIDYFQGEVKGSSRTRQLLSYFILTDLARYSDEKKMKLDALRGTISGFIKESGELPIFSRKINSYDYKKEFVNLIVESREDWPDVVYEILFETPVRIHKYILNNLIQANAYGTINAFIDTVIAGARQYPEIFLWVARNLLSGTWDYDWLDYSQESLALSFFRFMNELKKIENDGNRMKNATVDVLMDNNQQVMKDLAGSLQPALLNRLYDTFQNVSFVEESQAERFLEIIRELNPGFSLADTPAADEVEDTESKLIVTPESLERKRAEYDAMVNTELVQITKELTRVSEQSADIRENVDYNVLLEKQQILKLAIARLDEELKQAEVLERASVSTETVQIGTEVTITDESNGDSRTYAILGPWDADFEKGILSYRSPLARKLLGLKESETATLDIDDQQREYMVKSIELYNGSR